MASHYNLSCNDLKFRWKIEPIKKQEDKLKVIIKGEEAALDRLVAQREATNACKGAAPRLRASDAADAEDCKSFPKLQTDDNRQEIVLRLRCERRRKKLRELHGKKLAILWDFVEEWLKLKVNRLSAESFLKKDRSVINLAQYYIKYPRDIWDEEDLWTKAEKIMAKTSSKLKKQCEIKGPEDSGESQPSIRTECGVVMEDSGGLDTREKTIEILPTQKSKNKYVDSSESTESSLVWEEKYLNQVASTSCPWQQGCLGRDDWEFAKKLQLETAKSSETISQSNKVFFGAAPGTSKTEHPNDNLTGETMLLTIVEPAQSWSNAHREAGTSSISVTHNANGATSTKSKSRRGRGGCLKKQHRSPRFSKNRAEISSRPVGISKSRCWSLVTDGASVKSYAKAVAEPKPLAARSGLKKRNETITVKLKDHSREQRITSLGSAESSQSNIGRQQCLPGENARTEHLNTVESKESCQIIHTQVYTASKRPEEPVKLRHVTNAKSPEGSERSRKMEKMVPEKCQCYVTTKSPDKLKRSLCDSLNKNLEELIGSQRDTLSNKSQEKLKMAYCDIVKSSTEKSGQSSSTASKKRVENSAKDSCSTAKISPEKSRISHRADSVVSCKSTSAATSDSSKRRSGVRRIARDKTEPAKGMESAKLEDIVQQTNESPKENEKTSHATSSEPIKNINKSEAIEFVIKYGRSDPFNEANCVSNTVQTSKSSDHETISLCSHIPEQAEQHDQGSFVVPPLDLSSLSNNSDETTHPEPSVISFVGDSYDSSIILGDSFEQRKIDDQTKVCVNMSPVNKPCEGVNEANAFKSSVFNFFFQGHPTGSKLPDGFPRVDALRNQGYSPKDFRPFQNSWLGGLPGAISPFSPGGFYGQSYNWNNYYNAKATAEQWSPNEEASRHLKRMLRITSDNNPSTKSEMPNGFAECDSHGGVDNSSIHSHLQFAPNISVTDSNDRGDPSVVQLKPTGNLSTLHESQRLRFEEDHMSKSCSKSVALQDRTSYHEEVPQRLRRSDSDEDIESFFPSSSVFDSNSLEI